MDEQLTKNQGKQTKHRLMLVDGSNFLFQMFYGMPSRIINHQGKSIHGTLGFVGALLKVIRMVNPTHLVVVFDGEHRNSRLDLDVNYKANRLDYSMVQEEKNPYSQLPDIVAAMNCLEIAVIETTDCEADDMIASYAALFKDKEQVIVVSQDSDFYSLIAKNIQVLQYRGKNSQLISRQWILEKYNIEPAQFADYKALVGDLSDHIQGAERVGPKTAARLLNEFGTLKNILMNIDRIELASIQASVKIAREKLERNAKLIQLQIQKQLPLAFSELEFYDKGMTTNEVLLELGLKEKHIQG